MHFSLFTICIILYSVSNYSSLISSSSPVSDSCCQGISDGLVSRLAILLALPIPPEAVSAQQRSYVTYTLSNLYSNAPSADITLLEARNLFAAGGTTGFRTWDACLHLGVYLSSPSCGVLIAKRNVLELGAGTGYLSILCAKYLDAAHVTATDGSDTLVADMATNFYLNGLHDSTAIYATDLKWGHALLGGEQEEWNQGRQIDVVLGADVTYDHTEIPALVATLDDLIELFPSVQILIAATIRHEKTFETLLGTCAMNGLVVEDVHFPVIPKDNQQGPFYSDLVPIRICSIRKISL